MKRAFKFDHRLFYSDSNDDFSKAKAAIKTHPNVFDLETLLMTVITRLWNHTPQRRMSGLVKKNDEFRSLEEK